MENLKFQIEKDKKDVLFIFPVKFEKKIIDENIEETRNETKIIHEKEENDGSGMRI